MPAPKNNKNALRGTRPRVRMFITIDADLADAVRENAVRGEISAICEQALEDRFVNVIK